MQAPPRNSLSLICLGFTYPIRRRFDKDNSACFSDIGDVMIITIKGSSVIIYERVSGKDVDYINTDRMMIEIFSDGEIICTSSFIPTKLRPNKTMFGFSSYDRKKEAILSMKMELGKKKKIDIIALTIVADSDSIIISQ